MYTIYLHFIRQIHIILPENPKKRTLHGKSVARARATSPSIRPNNAPHQIEQTGHGAPWHLHFEPRLYAPISLPGLNASKSGKMWASPGHTPQNQYTIARKKLPTRVGGKKKATSRGNLSNARSQPCCTGCTWRPKHPSRCTPAHSRPPAPEEEECTNMLRQKWLAKDQ